MCTQPLSCQWSGTRCHPRFLRHSRRSLPVAARWTRTEGGAGPDCGLHFVDARNCGSVNGVPVVSETPTAGETRSGKGSPSCDSVYSFACVAFDNFVSEVEGKSNPAV